MAMPRDGFVTKGFVDVESYLQSGNVRLYCSLRSAGKVEDLCGFTVRTIVITPAQVSGLTTYGAGPQLHWTASCNVMSCS